MFVPGQMSQSGLYGEFKSPRFVLPGCWIQIWLKPEYRSNLILRNCEKTNEEKFKLLVWIHRVNGVPILRHSYEDK